VRSNTRFTLKQLQYFAAVARTGQISLAAAETHVTQSTMTAAIAELEHVLGTLLFERGRTGVALTHDGHFFLQHANAVLDAETTLRVIRFASAAKWPARCRWQPAMRYSAISCSFRRQVPEAASAYAHRARRARPRPHRGKCRRWRD